MLALLASVSVPAAAAAASGTPLEAAVINAMLARTGQTAEEVRASGRTFQVNVARGDVDTGWAFGSAVITAPRRAEAYPDGWLFLARRAAQSWQVALDDTTAFLDLARAAPATVVSGRERQAFEAFHRGPRALATDTPGVQDTTSYTTELTLPFTVGQTWRLTGGPHGGGGVWSNVDMNGGDYVVRAAGPGNVYTMCSNNRGWLRIYHPNGYTSDYYHLWNNITPPDGSPIASQAFLGYTGTDVCAGGSATGRHVHWGVRKGTTAVSWHLRSAGKWVFFRGASQYEGYALHGSYRVNIGGGMHNHGVLWQNEGIVDVNGGSTLNRRSGPGTNYPVVGTVADGATVAISCHRRGGTYHVGRYGGSNVWDKLSDGSWVSDAFVYTGMVLIGPAC